MNGKVYIVGAGPGNPDLLTVRADRVIRKADVLLHDLLISDELMAIFPEQAEKVCVGKRFGDKQDQTERQDMINQLMAEKARAGLSVVRIKSGDPLIFGRGIEEIRYLVEQGIDFELVPGITAGIAGANLFCIPLTERSRNTSVIFCTGHTINNEMGQFDAILPMFKAGSPLVVYMGLKNLPKILAKFRQVGIPDSLQVSILSKISHTDQCAVEGTLATIEARLQEQPLEMPVLIYFGENVHSVK